MIRARLGLVIGLWIGGAVAPVAGAPFEAVLTSPHNFLPRSENPVTTVCTACHADDAGYRASAVSADAPFPGQPIVEPPHQQDPTSAPLWQPGAPAFAAARDTPGGASSACLGCHDGVLGREVHQSGARPSRVIDHPFNTAYPRRANGQFRPERPTVNQFRYWSLPDLTSEGFVFPTGPASQRLVLPPETAIPDLASLQTVRTTGGVMHCDSCHNPHDNGNAPFLRAPAQDLCLICHNR